MRLELGLGLGKLQHPLRGQTGRGKIRVRVGVREAAASPTRDPQAGVRLELVLGLGQLQHPLLGTHR